MKRGVFTDVFEIEGINGKKWPLDFPKSRNNSYDNTRLYFWRLRYPLTYTELNEKSVKMTSNPAYQIHSKIIHL
ncbi:MAG: hypothetical protein DRR08_02715 [Candidatus Parabeggiatoa sp. nov. 2]|nr:MAG: hypothetical protein B6247_07350 [Beggiatoa sp. 4572_84]RKZ63653.1 MAG: hypothetical protein DRR08_02715 [Gammaproteobacteria bacterium]